MTYTFGYRSSSLFIDFEFKVSLSGTLMRSEYHLLWLHKGLTDVLKCSQVFRRVRRLNACSKNWCFCGNYLKLHFKYFCLHQRLNILWLIIIDIKITSVVVLSIWSSISRNRNIEVFPSFDRIEKFMVQTGYLYTELP